MAYIFVYLFLALPINGLLFWIAILPDTLPALLRIETIPVLMRGIAGMFGLVLAIASLAALRHGLRLQWIVRREEPKPVRVSIAVNDSSDTTTYVATVDFIGSDASWRTPIYYNKAVDPMIDGSAQRVETWLDGSKGAPVGLRVDGKLVLTYPKAIRTYGIVRSQENG